MKNIIDCQIFKTNLSISLVSFKRCKSNLSVAYNMYVNSPGLSGSPLDTAPVIISQFSYMVTKSPG